METSLSHKAQVRTFQIINHILFVIGLYFISIDAALISLFVYWTFGVLGVNIGLHRLLAHRSFETYDWFEKLVSIIAVINTMGSPIAWVAVHRKHHKSTDIDGDPHAPGRIGKWNVFVGRWDKFDLDLGLVRDMRSDLFQRALHKYYSRIILSYIAILGIIDPWLIIYGYSIPVTLIYYSATIVNVLGHGQGYRNYQTPCLSTNSWIASVATLGDGWHNNHHANPRDWSLWHKWWEIDVSSLVIRIIKK